MVGAKTAYEIGVSDDVVPLPADEAGTGQGGGLWREAEKDLGEDVVVVWQPWWEGAAAANAAAPVFHRVGFGMV
jgi:hypothetical protein